MQRIRVQWNSARLIQWTFIGILTILIGLAAFFYRHQLPNAIQVMKDSIQADTQATVKQAAAFDYHHAAEKIPTIEDSLEVSMTVDIWHADTIRIGGLPAGAILKVRYPDRHAYVIDTADQTGHFIYPHILKK